MKEFKLPDVGEGLTEAEIVRWHVKAGDPVKVNQIIVEIETAKAVVELPCPFEGVVAALMADEGEVVDVGRPIISVDDGTGPLRHPLPPRIGRRRSATTWCRLRRPRSGSRCWWVTASNRVPPSVAPANRSPPVARPVHPVRLPGRRGPVRERRPRRPRRPGRSR